MNVFDENTALRRLGALLVSERDGVHPAHAENRVAAAVRLAEAYARSEWSHLMPLSALGDSAWLTLSGRVGMAKAPSHETRELAIELARIEAEGF